MFSPPLTALLVGCVATAMRPPCPGAQPRGTHILRLDGALLVRNDDPGAIPLETAVTRP